MSTLHTSSVCIFGEVLFDQLPDGRRILGGAPFNVAWHLSAFGLSPHFISCVGDDAAGAEVRYAMQDWGLSTAGLQVDDTLPTGCVTVTLNNAGDPMYNILDHCAYDAIQSTPLKKYHLLYHGSLAARHTLSANSLYQLRNAGHDAVFVDVNLREPYWNRESVLALVNGADWVKLNADELQCLVNVEDNSESAANYLLETCKSEGLLTTAGAQGARLLLADGECIEIAPQSGRQVVDTIGAGDAFSAVMILGIIMQWPLSATLERCQAFAGSIVEQPGATVADRDFYSQFIREWRLETHNKRI